MSDNLRSNNVLFGFEGVIARREYLLNLVYIAMINLFFTLPYTSYVMTHAQTFTDFFMTNELFWRSSLFLKVWVLAGTSLTAVLFISNTIRRLNDIYGQVNQKLNVVVSFLFVLSAFMPFFNIRLAILLLTLSSLVGFYLLVKKGKITGQYPYDFLKEFNWAAFFATWIWGLINKSYKTLWMLLLAFTPWGFYYSLVCGLKGNKWAYYNKKWESDEKFKSSQETQTLVFVLLNVVVIPLICVILATSLVGVLIFSAFNDAKNPTQQSKTVDKLDSFMRALGSECFSSYVITKNENKFYVLPKDWTGASFKDKKGALELAASIAASDRQKQDKKGYYSKTTELRRTKIYSSKNRELLGEFVFDDSISDSTDLKMILKASMNAYRFYNPTVI